MSIFTKLFSCPSTRRYREAEQVACEVIHILKERGDELDETATLELALRMAAVDVYPPTESYYQALEAVSGAMDRSRARMNARSASRLKVAIQGKHVPRLAL